MASDATAGVPGSWTRVTDLPRRQQHAVRRAPPELGASCAAAPSTATDASHIADTPEAPSCEHSPSLTPMSQPRSHVYRGLPLPR